MHPFISYNEVSATSVGQPCTDALALHFVCEVLLGQLDGTCWTYDLKGNCPAMLHTSMLLMCTCAIQHGHCWRLVAADGSEATLDVASWLSVLTPDSLSVCLS